MLRSMAGSPVCKIKPLAWSRPTVILSGYTPQQPNGLRRAHGTAPLHPADEITSHSARHARRIGDETHLNHLIHWAARLVATGPQSNTQRSVPSRVAVKPHGRAKLERRTSRPLSGWAARDSSHERACRGLRLLPPGGAQERSTVHERRVGIRRLGQLSVELVLAALSDVDLLPEQA